MKYDFKRAKKLIENNKHNLKSAVLGMDEDWFWTATEIWNEKEGYLVDLNTVETIAGISGSYWATPTLEFEYKKDGLFVKVACYTED